MGGAMGTFGGGRTHVNFFFDHEKDSELVRLEAVVVQRCLSAEPPMATGRSVLPAGFDASVGSEGPYQVLFSHSRGIARVANRDFPVPSDGRTLVLLCEESSDPRVGWMVKQHAIDVPRTPFFRVDRSLTKPQNIERMNAMTAKAHQLWMRTVNEDPVIRAFMAADGDQP